MVGYIHQVTLFFQTKYHKIFIFKLLKECRQLHSSKHFKQVKIAELVSRIESTGHTN